MSSTEPSVWNGANDKILKKDDLEYYDFFRHECLADKKNSSC